jgi:riboflavin transporter FmnP
MYVIFDVLFLVVRVEYNASELCNYLYHITLLVVFWITFQQKKTIKHFKTHYVAYPNVLTVNAVIVGLIPSYAKLSQTLIPKDQSMKT